MAEDSMTGWQAFTPLERAALEAIIADAGPVGSTIGRQVRHARVVARTNSGGGFFTEIQVDPEAPRLACTTDQFGKAACFAVEGLDYGLGVVLHSEDRRLTLLEAYAHAPETTAPIDFARVAFAPVAQPGPLPRDAGP